MDTVVCLTDDEKLYNNTHSEKNKLAKPGYDYGEIPAERLLTI